MRIVVRKQNSGLNAGAHSCFRVGSQVLINSPGDKGNKGGGLARITKLSLVKLDALKKSQLKGKYFASDDAFFAYKDDMKFRLKPDHQGIVTILDFDYVAASATDEKELQQKDVEESNGDAYEETQKEGDSISKCSKPWTDVIVPDPEFQQAILAGKLLSFYNWGERNCLTQGQTANIKTAFGAGGTVLGQVKIAKIKKFRASYVDPKYFVATDFDLLKLKTKIQLENKEEFITVMDFVPPNGGGVKEGEKGPAKDASCVATDGVVTAIRLTQDAVENGVTSFDIMIHGKTCLKEGDLIHIAVAKDGKFYEMAVRVLTQTFDENMKSSSLKVQHLETLTKGIEL
jgi:hypothetical protein